MADGASGGWGPRRWLGSGERPLPNLSQPRHEDSKLKKAKVAYSGEEYGFGYKALENYSFKVNGKKNRDGYEGDVPDAGKPPKPGQSRKPRTFNIDLDGGSALPLRSKDQALSTVVSGNADFALVPFYNPHSGYDTETLNLLSNMLAIGVDQVDAGDQFCLAVYEPQVLDLVQASHPGSALSYLMRGRNNWSQRTTWSQRAVDRGIDLLAEESPHHHRDRKPSEGYSAGLAHVDQAGQLLLRDRVDVVFVGPEAMRRCKAKLDGLRAAGVKVEETLEWVEPHREMARRVREALDNARQTSTALDTATGETKFTSVMSAAAQSRPLYALVLPFEVANRSPEFTIIDANLEDKEAPTTRFLVVEKQGDPTLKDDTYALTFRRVRYWLGRMLHVGRESALLKLQLHDFARALMGLGVFGVVLFDLVRYFAQANVGMPAAFEGVFGSQLFGAFSIGLTVVPWATLLTLDTLRGGLAEFVHRNKTGVRVLLQFVGVGQTASLADIEEHLRYFGVSFRKTQTREDSGGNPSDAVLDIEFPRRSFDWHPVLLKSIAQETLRLSFNAAKHGTVKVLAAMPFHTPQLPVYKKRRWWLEGAQASAEHAQKRNEARLVLGYRSLVGGLPMLVALGLLAFATYRVGGVDNMIHIVARLLGR